MYLPGLIKLKIKETFHSYNLMLNFYPSVTLELLNKTIQFAKEITPISDENLNIIMQSRKTLLFHNQEPWVKREGEEDFDVPMGCYDGQKFAN